MKTLLAPPDPLSTAVVDPPARAPLAGLGVLQTDAPPAPVIPTPGAVPQTALAVGATWTGVSVAGKPVTVTAERNGYEGAAVYFTVRYGSRGGATRYTPSWARARVLVTRFLADVTDPAGLR